MNTQTQPAPTHLELSTIQPIPRERRHGTAADLFTVWFGSNFMLLTVVTGGLAVTIFGLSFGWASLALVLGNLIGAVFMALHSAQGPTLGVPQMIQTRGQFGSYGSLLVVAIVIIMYMGFMASNLVLAGEAITSLAPGVSDAPGVALVGVLSLIAAIFGYDLIHTYARAMTYVSIAVLVLTFVYILAVHGLPADFSARNHFHLAGFIGTISAAALWQIAYAPYVSDYSRYMRPDLSPRTAFWASYWGCALGSLLPMILGAVVGIIVPKGSLVAGLATLTGPFGPLVLVVLTIGLATASAMVLYCGALCTLTFGQTLWPLWSPGATARAVIAVVIFGLSLAGALLGKSTFMATYTDFILLLLYVLVPWTAINLVDYYLVRQGSYDVAAFFRDDGGMYGRFNIIAIGCYVMGILVQIPFIDNPLYSGRVARLAGGVDLSWIVGLAVTGPVYYLLAKRAPGASAPAATKL